MPKLGTGEERLTEVREAARVDLAARTALAIQRLQLSSSSSVIDLTEPEQEVIERSAGSTDQQSSSLSGGVDWARHDFGSSDLLVFSRDNGEILTIRKSPTGEAWLIIYDEAVEDGPE